MATLTKLEISGIRSFGADRADQQRIYFDKPFNLILGRNGCGKTTVIESLKYACSGTMPSGQGASFVRDPKLDKQTETRAQIKLNFVSARGDSSTITRSMSSKSSGQGKHQFKTLDTSSEIMKNGKPEQMSGRCVDMDDLMASLLGVSKPILNYVIFCHQEDSHWPLDEAKKLKERFDEIFDSTKYNKCMIEVRKQRKIAIDEKKLAEVSMKHLESDVIVLKQKRGELQLLNERFSTMEQKLKAYDEEISKYEEENTVWRQRYKNYEKCKVERDEAKNQLAKFVYEQETEKKHITVLFTGSEEELQVEIRNFDNQLQIKQKTLQRTQKELQKLAESQSDIQNKISETHKIICKLETDKEQEKKTEAERNLQISNLAKTFDLTGLTVGATDEDADLLHNQIKRKFQTLVSSINALKLQQEKEQNNLQEEINRCLQDKAKIESEIGVKEDSVSSNDNELRILEDKLRSVNENLIKQQKIDKELEECCEKRDKAKKEEDPEALSSKLDELQLVCSRLETKQSQLSKELVDLLKYQDDQKKLQTQEEKLKDGLSQIQRLRCKNEDSISKLLPHSTDSTIRQDFDSLLQKLKREVDQLKNQKIEKNSEIVSLEHNRSNKKKILEEKQAALQKKKESLFQLCGKKKLDEVLQGVETEIETVQNDKGLYASTQVVLGGYVKQLKQKDPCCPLCHRQFTDDHESSDLVDEIISNMNVFPHKVEEVNEKLTKLQQKQSSLLQLKPVEKDVLDLESQIPDLQNDVFGLEGVLDATREELGDVEKRLQEPERDLHKAEVIQNVIFEIDRYQKENKQCVRQIESMKRELSHLSSASRTSEQCAAEQQLISDELAESRRKKDGVEKCQREYLRRINDFEQKINQLKAQQLKIKESVQEEKNMKKRWDELSQSNKLIQSELEDLNQKLKPAFEKKRQAEEALDETKEKHKRIIQDMESKKQDKEVRIQMLVQTKNTLKELRSHKISESLLANKEMHEQLMQKSNELKVNQEDLVTESNDLQEALGENAKRKKELEGNMTVLKLSKQIQNQEKLLEIAEKKLGDTDHKGVVEKINDIEDKISEVKSEVNELKGNRKGLQENIKSREDELRGPQYRNAEKNFKKKLIEVTVRNHTERDLQKYYNALDTAMQHFHRDRMACVNKSIRELWRLIYRGNDIDFIEIKTDEASQATASNATDKRRSYNYRVVQVKNGTEIDMRGRCSAGQKVLASLIIRLALAETFSSNCGILALDEPTTNLDKDNVRSLCQAIVEIVNEREHTSSFQLICITHDHEFLDMMTEMDFFSHYWEVSRDHRSKSVIKKKEVMKE